MSIGLAFAQGLIGGFTKNIDREGARRDSDDLQFADLQKTVTDGVMKASAAGNPFPKELGKRLQDAKTAMMKSRDDIGLFGTGKSDRLNLSLTDLSGLMGDVASDDNNLVFGNKKIFKIPLAPSASTYNTDKTVRKSLFTSNYFFLNSVMPYLDTKKGRDSLTNAAKLDPTILTDIKNRYREAKSGVIEGHYGNQRAAGVLEENLKTFDFKRTYSYDNNTVTWMDNYSGQPEGNTVRAIEKAEKKFQEGNKLLAANPAEKNTLFFLTDEKNKDKNILSLLKLNVTDDQYKAAGEIAKLKFGDAARPSAWIFYQQQNTYGGVFETSKIRFSGEENPQDRVRKILEASFLSMNLVKDGFLKNDREGRLQSVRNLIKATRGNRIMMALAVAPLIKRELSNEEIAMKAGGLSKIIPLRKVAAMKKDFKIDFEKFDKAFGATFTAYKKIETIMALEELNAGGPNDEIGDNLARSMVTAFGGAFNEGGTVTSIWGIVTGGAGVTEDRENNTEDDFKRTIMQAARDGYLNSSTKYSVIDALKLSVAADMARAIDPNGRLSNQDFQIQLERLGKGSFNSKQQTRFKLRIIQEEFRDRYERLEVINRIFNENDLTNKSQIGLSANERDLLTADAKVQTLVESIGLNSIRSIEAGLPEGSNQTFSPVPRSDGHYYLTDIKQSTIIRNREGLYDIYKKVDGQYIKLSPEAKKIVIQNKNSTQPVGKDTGKNDKNLDAANERLQIIPSGSADVSDPTVDQELIDFNTNHENWSMQSGGNKSQARWTSPDGKTILSLKWNKNTNKWERM